MSNKILSPALAIVGGVLLVAAFFLLLAAIWAPDNGDKFFLTAVLLGVTGAISGFLSLDVETDEWERQRRMLAFQEAVLSNNKSGAGDAEA